MKKMYMKPEIDETLVAAEQALLAGSLDVEVTDAVQDNTDALSKELGVEFNIFE